MDDTTLVAALHRALTESALALEESEVAHPSTQLAGRTFAQEAGRSALDVLLDAVTHMYLSASDNSSLPGWDEAEVILGEVLANDVATWRDGQAS